MSYTRFQTTVAIKGGKMIIRNRVKFLEDIERIYNGEGLLTFEKGTKRSLQFCRYYFGGLKYLIDAYPELGLTVEEAHEISKATCALETHLIADKNTGEIQEMKVGKSTASMTTDEFAEFLERTRRWWAENGYVILDEYWLEPVKQSEAQ